MKPILSDKLICEAVVKEVEDDSEIGSKHLSVTVVDGAVTSAGAS
jgi:hypothetical protein